MPIYVVELKQGKVVYRKASFEDLKEVVYTLTQLIPIGSVVTYGDLAKILRISPRVIGKILSENTKPIVVPCHRIVSSKGLGGYTLIGKKDPGFKKKLLQLEYREKIRKFNLCEFLGLDRS
jgi:methylated-DNA-[protein]-cysteine S-methyltransferase